MAEGALSGGTLRGCTCLKCTNQADGERVPTEYAEHTEPSGRESLPQIDTDAHRLGGYGIPAIPTPPITQPNHLWIPWENTTTLVQLPLQHQQSKQKECSHRTRRTHRIFWQRKPPTDRHGYAQIRRVWHPAIPTPPITQPNHLWKSVKSVGEYYHAGAAASTAPTKQTERVSHRTRGTHRTFWQRKPPTDCTDVHRLGGKNAT